MLEIRAAHSLDPSLCWNQPTHSLRARCVPRLADVSSSQANRTERRRWWVPEFTVLPQ